MSLTILLSKLFPHHPGANELNINLEITLFFTLVSRAWITLKRRASFIVTLLLVMFWVRIGCILSVPVETADMMTSWKHFPLYWPFVQGNHWSIPLTKASDAELWCFLLICAWTNGWVNNRDASDLRRNHSLWCHCYVQQLCLIWRWNLLCYLILCDFVFKLNPFDFSWMNLKFNPFAVECFSEKTWKPVFIFYFISILRWHSELKQFIM